MFYNKKSPDTLNHGLIFNTLSLPLFFDAMNTSLHHPPLSLMSRMLLVTGLALMVLLGVVGYVLDRAFINSVRRDEYNKIHDVALVLLSTIQNNEQDMPFAPNGWMHGVKKER